MPNTSAKPLVLASASPRRASLLREAGITFDVSPQHGADESFDATWAPTQIVESLARRKAESAVSQFPGRFILGADTIVVHEGDVLGKPRDPDDAAAMLRRLSDRWHDVWTGVAIVAPGNARAAHVGHVRTALCFRALEDEEIERYVAGGEPMDKAGAYAIQGEAAEWVTKCEGPIDNVIGLPVLHVERYLGVVGYGR